MLTTRRFIELRQLARVMGIPAEWLRAEAREGRLPHLRVGRRYIFPTEEVHQRLLERAGVRAETHRDAEPAST